MERDLAVRGVAWDLGALYASPRDPRLQADLGVALERARGFAARYRGTINVPGGPTPEWVAGAVAEIEAIYEQADKPGVYAHLLHAADVRPPEHGALVAETLERQSAVRTEMLFFELEWVALDDASAATIIRAPSCARYRHYLVRLREYRPHLLTEPEERLLEETANTGERAFSRLFDELLSCMVFAVEIDGTRQQLNESGVLALLRDPRREIRRRAAAALTAKLKEHALVLRFVFNLTAQHHALTDRLRHFADPMSARHLANEIDGTTVAAMMAACENRVGMVVDYYRLKRGLLGLERLCDYDRYAPITGDEACVTWPQARELVLSAYGDFAPRMREVAELFFAGRWIDAEVREGKQGGAFSSATVPSVHPYVLLSYLGSPRDVMTLAHELGHGVHQYLARERGYLQSDSPLTMAETASVFGELLVFERLRRDTRDPRALLTLLCGFVEEAFGTVFRQIALTRFEQALHARRRAEGELSDERIGALWRDANAAMYGDAVELTDDYGWWWAYIPHFVHTPFYCYAYSFGELLVLSLYRLYRERGPAFVPQYLELLAAGGSASPSALLAGLGVDIRDPTFWDGGLTVLGEMVAEVKRLTVRAELESGTAPAVTPPR